ncbi:MAG: phage head-tail adapter protein [Parvibaculum sp.]|nr:phage head-tail adapter protein [Parvibaculum sp.]MAN64637.1 phage head-tail adapter protein [Parvibaculum sp.]
MDFQDTDAIFKRYERMKSKRGTWESLWEEISERVLPRSSEFTGTRTPGDKRTDKMYDATSALALERFAAAVESLLTPRGARWHTLRTSDPELSRVPEVAAWFDAVENALFHYRYAPRANFASQMHEGYLSLGAFGTGGMFVDEKFDEGFRYRAVHLSDMFIAENEHGIIDTVYRKMDCTARQVALMFNDEDISKEVRDKANDNPDERVELLHVVAPRTDRDVSMRDRINMEFGSAYYETKTKTVIEEGGYEDFPYIISRYVTGPRETYGRSPAMLVLPDIKMLQAMSRVVIRAGEKVVDPPLLIADDGVILPVNTRAGGATFARLDGRTQAPIQPLNTGGRPDIGEDMMERRRRTINDAFLVTLFQILVDSPAMTATEVLQRAQEKGALLAPTVGRQQSETLGPLIERELGILARQGLLPEVPEILQGQEYQVEYVSPLSRAMKSEEGVGILRTLEMVQPIAAVDPSVMDNFNFDEITRVLADVNGVPQSILNDQEQIQQVRQGRAQQQQLQQAVQAAPQAADAALKISQISQAAQQ